MKPFLLIEWELGGGGRGGSNLEEWVADGGIALQRHGHSQVDRTGQPDMDQGQQQRDQLFEGPGQVQPAAQNIRKFFNLIFVIILFALKQRKATETTFA
jgi:hypothetical protein